MDIPLKERRFPTEPPRSCGGRRAFTLVELLIAVTITAVILGVCFWIIGEMQRHTRLGLARLTILKSSEVLNKQLRLDFASLVGPNATEGQSAGCLLIVPGVRQGYVPTVQGKSTHKVRLRSDQIIFCADGTTGSWLGTATRHDFFTLTPTEGNSAAARIRSSQARVWIGAVKVDDSEEAQHWGIGRQALLLGRQAANGQRDSAFDLPVGDMTVGSSDAVTGSLANLADAACGTSTFPNGVFLRGTGQRSLGTHAGTDWTDTQYLEALLGPGIPDDSANYTNLPESQADINLYEMRRQASPVPPLPVGALKLDELNKTLLQLVPNCSEIIIQWAGDLDKDGVIDTYPVGIINDATNDGVVDSGSVPHPLGGAIIWYPEDNHASASKDVARARYSLAMGAKYDAIRAAPWGIPSAAIASPQTFPFGFRGPAQERFGGHGDQSTAWYRGFEFDYGEYDGTGTPRGQAVATDIHVPPPFVFRFEDDQYRLVNYGFRQDGSAFKNKHDGKWTPFGGSNHWFPIPPIVGAYGANTCNPPMSVLYKDKNAPVGPYPAAAATAAAVNTNFGDLMGDQPLPTDMFGSNPFITAGGFVFNITAISSQSEVVQFSAASAAATGTETPWPPAPHRHPAGTKVAFPDVAANGTYVLSGSAGPADDTETLLDPYAFQVLNHGVGNNHIANYRDVVTPWLKAVNDPALAGTRADWRNPQSDWPRLIRIRVRLHDPQGLVFSYSDEAQSNGRDDDGDGLVDNPEEARISGIWSEYIFAIPYPHDPAPRQH